MTSPDGVERTTTVQVRPATADDVPRIVALLADDPLGARREAAEDPLPDSYHEAYRAIAADPNQHLVVLEVEGRVEGTLQLSIIPYLTYRGGRRALIEAVRVSREVRSEGFGRLLIGWAIDQARTAGCHLVQLTTDKQRPEALRFYEGLGFRASHEGLKLHL